MLEIEKRGFLTEDKHDQLIRFFLKNGVDLGQDDKEVVYYIYNDKLLKLVHNLSKKNVKISLKTNKIGEGSVFPETEIIFNEEDFLKIKFILDTVANPDKKMEGIQKRRNFKYKNCEFAIKWSKEWGFHFEIEKMIDNEALASKAEKEIEKIATELDMKIMTEEELKNFTKKAEENADNEF